MTEKKDKMTHFERVFAAHARTKKKNLLVTLGILAGMAALSVLIAKIDIGELRDLPKIFNYIRDTLPVLRPESFGFDLAEWYWGIRKWINMLADTVLMAVLATLISFIIAFFLSFFAARNLMKNTAAYFLVRRFLEILRGVPDLLYALIFVFAFNIGPLPGILAIVVHSTGALGKLFSEVNENVDVSSTEGVLSCGADWSQTIRYAVVPQVLPNFLSYGLLRLEINIRAASIIGFVGAGGIGMELMKAIRSFQYQDISAIVLLIIGVVIILDKICETLRHKVTGDEVLI